MFSIDHIYHELSISMVRAAMTETNGEMFNSLLPSAVSTLILCFGVSLYAYNLCTAAVGSLTKYMHKLTTTLWDNFVTNV